MADNFTAQENNVGEQVSIADVLSTNFLIAQSKHLENASSGKVEISMGSEADTVEIYAPSI